MKQVSLVIVLVVIAFIAGAHYENLGELLKAIPIRLNFHWHFR